MSRYDQYSDEELIFRLRQGEMEISDYLMEKYKEFVRKKARAMFLIGGERQSRITSRIGKRLFRHLQVCVLTGSFTVRYRIQTGRNIFR